MYYLNIRFYITLLCTNCDYFYTVYLFGRFSSMRDLKIIIALHYLVHIVIFYTDCKWNLAKYSDLYLNKDTSSIHYVTNYYVENSYSIFPRGLTLIL